MKIAARIGFWDQGTTCFCHEAVARQLHEHFPTVEISDSDLAHQKYRSVISVTPSLARSAWNEFLRDGPRFAFSLGTGVTGVFNRYEVEFDISNSTGTHDIAAIRAFLGSLAPRSIIVEEVD